jgi:predicted NBD/HSP70 family sugar kinase
MVKAMKAMPSDLRVENCKAVLQSFRDADFLAITDISEKTKISRQTIDKIVKSYIEKGILIELKKGSSSDVGGKPPKLFSLNTAKRFLLILLHHHEIQLRVTDLFYHETAAWKSRAMRIQTMDCMWEIVKQGIRAILPDRTDIAGICMSVPLGTDINDCLTVATPFPYWPSSDYGRSLRTPLEELFPAAGNIIVLADGRVAGSALMKENKDLCTESLVVTIYASSGIGGALFDNGVLQLGYNHLDGIIGHIVVNPDFSEVCTCGEHGCLEQMVNRDRLYKRLKLQEDAYLHSTLSDIRIEDMTFEKLFHASDAGDSFCQKESLYYADMFAIALHNIQVCIDPTVVVFQGDFRFADSVFKNELQAKLRVFTYTPAGVCMKITYDDKDLETQETVGGTYLLLTEYLNNPEKYFTGE